jgi:isopentenyl-diphosphate delta-isomerase
VKYNGKVIISYRCLAILVGVLILLGVGAFFTANVPLPVWASWASELNIVLFAAPCFWASVRWLGRRDAVLLFVVFGGLALVVETLAIATGFPYGHFRYSEMLGYRIGGYAPWTIVLAWTPLVLTAYAVAARAVGSPFFRPFLVAALLMVFDLVIDPGAVKMGFWQYPHGGGFYGVPLSNYLGWLLSGLIAGSVFEGFVMLRKPLLPAPAQLISSGFLVIFFWSGIDVFSGLVVPAMVGAVVLTGLVAFYIRYRYAFDDMIVYVDESDRPTGTAPKLAAHNGETRRHMAFSAFLFDRGGKLLLQQRAFSKKTWPGVWSNSCCGHVMLHENVLDAARRRIRYELGIKASDLTIVLPDFRYRAEKDGVVENEICPVLVGFAPATMPRFNPEEVNSVRWIRWEDFLDEVRDPANGYSPWAIEETELLFQTDKFQELYAGRLRRKLV